MNLPAIRMRNVRRIAALADPKARSMACRIVRNDAAGTPARLDVYDDIGGGGWFGGGISAADVVAQLADIDGPVDVHINSGGGDVFDGIAIYNALAARDGVTIVVDGIAASIASIIAQAGQSRTICPGAMMMIHDALSLCMGNAADMRETADLLDQVSQNLASVYASRGGTVAGWRDAMQAETWYTAQDAVDAGLMDALAGKQADPADVAAHNFAVFARLPKWVRAAAGQDGDDAPDCKTCGGSGRLKHPTTGKNGKTCPGCDGTGKAPSGDDGDEGDGEENDDTAQDRGRRVLGLESMPLADGPIAVHHTATVDEPWDGPAAVKGMAAQYGVLHYAHAWQDDSVTPSSAAGDVKGNYKFPHHKSSGAAANVNACEAILANLAGGRTAADIPDEDVAKVKAHAQAHLDDAQNGKSSDHHHTPVNTAAFVASFRDAFKEV